MVVRVRVSFIQLLYTHILLQLFVLMVKPICKMPGSARQAVTKMESFTVVSKATILDTMKIEMRSISILVIDAYV